MGISRSMSDEDKGPYQFVFLQECTYMGALVGEMVRSLAELQLGFKGELTMSEQMENLMNSLYMEKIPPRWMKLAFPSSRPLQLWLSNLKERCVQLEDWTADPVNIPKVVDVSKVFTDVTKRFRAAIDSASREGAYVDGMFLEGARWDMNGNTMEESKPKEMFCKMPVINCKAGLATDSEKGLYVCPTYCTTGRRPNFVFAAQLRTKYPPRSGSCVAWPSSLTLASHCKVVTPQ